jgi:hypothetical protein
MEKSPQNKPMGLFPRKYCNQTHIQSKLFQRQKIIFYNDKLIYTQNLKFFLKFFTELRNSFFSLRFEFGSSVNYRFSSK